MQADMQKADNQTIRDLAYALWQARGSPVGAPDIDWLAAERQVLGTLTAVLPPPQHSSKSLADL